MKTHIFNLGGKMSSYLDAIVEFLKSDKMSIQIHHPDEHHDKLCSEANKINKENQYNGYIITIDSKPGLAILSKKDYASFKI